MLLAAKKIISRKPSKNDRKRMNHKLILQKAWTIGDAPGAVTIFLYAKCPETKMIER
jgi:hypothetical protein